MADTEKPLAGLRIALTRERDKVQTMRDALAQRGANVALTPLLKLSDAGDWTETDRCLGQAADYTWLVFSSAQAVVSLMNRVKARGLGAQAFGRCKIACVGPGTARAAQSFGLRVDLQPTTQNGQAMSHELRLLGLKPGSRVLAPRGNMASSGLTESLRQAGVIVDAPQVYTNAADADGARELARALAAGELDAVAFASPSAFKYALSALDDAAKDALRKVRIYSIGPATSDAVREAGFAVKEEAHPHDMQGMIAAITRGETGRG